MQSQFKLSQLGGGDPIVSAKLFNVGAPDNLLQYVLSYDSKDPISHVYSFKLDGSLQKALK